MSACGRSGGDAADAGSSGAAKSKRPAKPAANAVDPELGKTWCGLIRDVQSDLHSDAKSAAYLAQLALKVPDATARLSATVVDAAAKKECPAEYAKFLEQARIASRRSDSFLVSFAADEYTAHSAVGMRGPFSDRVPGARQEGRWFSVPVALRVHAVAVAAAVLATAVLLRSGLPSVWQARSPDSFAPSA